MLLIMRQVVLVSNMRTSLWVFLMISEYAAHYDSEFDICRFLSVTTHMLTSHTYMLLAKAFSPSGSSGAGADAGWSLCCLCSTGSLLCCQTTAFTQTQRAERSHLATRLSATCMDMFSINESCKYLHVFIIDLGYNMHFKMLMFLYKHNTPHTFTQRQLICSLE